MNALEIKMLLQSKQSEMMELCPVYRIEKAILESIRPILLAWPEPQGALFRRYDNLVQLHLWTQCAASYKYNLSQAKREAATGRDPFAAWEGDVVQEDLLENVPYPDGMREALHALIQAVKDRPADAGILDFYLLNQTDHMDLDNMFACYNGCLDGHPSPAYAEKIAAIIRPDHRIEPPWPRVTIDPAQ